MAKRNPNLSKKTRRRNPRSNKTTRRRTRRSRSKRRRSFSGSQRGGARRDPPRHRILSHDEMLGTLGRAFAMAAPYDYKYCRALDWTRGDPRQPPKCITKIDYLSDEHTNVFWGSHGEIMADADSTFKTFAEWCHTNHITLIINGGGPVGTRLNGFINKKNIHSTVFKSDGPLVSLAIARETPSGYARLAAPSPLSTITKALPSARRRADAVSAAAASAALDLLPTEAWGEVGSHLDPESQTRLGMAMASAGKPLVDEGRRRATAPSRRDIVLHQMDYKLREGAADLGEPDWASPGLERLVWLHEYNVDEYRQVVEQGWGRSVARMVTREALLTNELTALLDECSYHTRYIKKMNSPAPLVDLSEEWSEAGGRVDAHGFVWPPPPPLPPDRGSGGGNILVICDEGDDFSHLILGSLMINEDLARGRSGSVGLRFAPFEVMNHIRDITFLRPGSLSQYENINRYILDSYYKYVNRVRDEPHHRLERIVHPNGQYVGAGHVLIADVTASSRENLYGAPDGERPPTIQSPNNGKSIYSPVYATDDRWPMEEEIPPRRIPTVLPPL